MRIEKSELDEQGIGTISEVKHNFWHNVKRIFGGEYYEAKTDTTYWYAGEIKLWINCKWYNVKKWFLLRWYDIRIWLLKKCI